MRRLLNNNPAARGLSIGAVILYFIFQLLVVGVAFLAGFLTNQWGVLSWPARGAEFPVLQEAYQLLRENAIFTLPAEKEMEYGMIRGLVAAVNEPYTVFVDPPQAELQSDRLQGSFGGIGVRIERDEQMFIYLYPQPDSPGLRAGILDGDRLLAIESRAVGPDTSNEQIQSEIRGPVGESISITIGRSPDYAPIRLSVVREEVALPSVSWNLAAGQPTVGVIYINVIASTTPNEVNKAVEDLQRQGAERFVIDVRNNGGGLVDAGVDLARLFLIEGTVIEQQYHQKPVVAFQVERAGPLADLPMVVLVNRGTASAAEIFAGAMQSLDRAQIVGTRTFGKDTIQLVFSLSDGSSLHVTSARWWVPGLEPAIGGQGIVPDVLLDDAADETQLLLAAVDTVLK